MLWEDQTAPREQRHTARRIHERLAAEYGFDSASYSTICDYVQIRRPQIEAEARRGRQHREGMVLQVHLPGEEAEVDFAEVWVRLAGTAVKCHLFTLRLSYSGRPSTGSSPPRPRNRSWRATSRRSGCSAACRPGPREGHPASTSAAPEAPRGGCRA
ncbi:hypothetical protein AB0D45_00010 [Streptomyces sp. NPDC048352]|uniref:hypothetical protein n=1 Tax=Streptomyces sp. NPDC048352 TaxID=3154718 RepID=UPI00342D07FF